MPTTDTTEAGLETLIVRHLTGSDGLLAAEAADHVSDSLAEPPDAVAQALAGGSGWIAGRPSDYDRGFALDVVQLFAFLHATQPEAVKKLGIADYRRSADAEPPPPSIYAPPTPSTSPAPRRRALSKSTPTIATSSPPPPSSACAAST